MTQPAWSTLRAMYSQHRVSAQNLGSCWCPLTLHPEHCCSCFSPLKSSQDSTMSSGTKVVPGVPEGRGRITRGQLHVEASRVCHFFIWVRLSSPTILQEGKAMRRLRRAVDAWQNTIKMQPTANANTIISPKVPYVEKITAKMWWNFFLFLKETTYLNGLVFHTSFRIYCANPLSCPSPSPPQKT